MKPMPISSLDELIEEAFRFYQIKIEKVLPSLQNARNENSLIQKLVNFVTETVGTPSPSMKVIIDGEPLREALENVNKAIKIAEKSKEL